MTVGVGDERPGKTKDPRIAGERSRSQLRQLPVKAWRKVVADLADLLLDEVVVVEQPFGSRHHSSATFELRGARPVCREKDFCVVLQSDAQRQDSRRSIGHRLSGSQALGMLLQPFDPEEFFADRRRVLPNVRYWSRSEGRH